MKFLLDLQQTEITWRDKNDLRGINDYEKRIYKNIILNKIYLLFHSF